jgi:hypothetical protein
MGRIVSSLGRLILGTALAVESGLTAESRVDFGFDLHQR